MLVAKVQHRYQGVPGDLPALCSSRGQEHHASHAEQGHTTQAVAALHSSLQGPYCREVLLPHDPAHTRAGLVTHTTRDQVQSYPALLHRIFSFFFFFF